ncbi:MAG: peptidoglycan editing factor PgeF [Bacteroidales bacterium]|nr:peptidoglycan editing factor PgeF [Bacteroidales bacterium]
MQQGLNHYVLTRSGGISTGAYNSLNLSFNAGDNEANVNTNRKIVAGLLDVEAERLFFPEQCHTSNIRIVDKNFREKLPETDAIITAGTNIGIGVLSADCVPILFFDTKRRVIAAAHAGWRGTVKRITEKVVLAMRDNFGTDTSDILVGIGPGISQKNYEVDESVISQVRQCITKPGRFYSSSPNKGRYLLNLQQLNHQILADTGIPEPNIETIGKCTFDNRRLFFSARRDGFYTGRFGTVICMK